MAQLFFVRPGSNELLTHSSLTDCVEEGSVYCRYAGNPCDPEDPFTAAVLDQLAKIPNAFDAVLDVKPLPDDMEGNGSFNMTVYRHERHVNVLPVIKSEDGTFALFSKFVRDVDTFSGKKRPGESLVACSKRIMKDVGITISKNGLHHRPYKWINLGEEGKHTGILLVINDTLNKSTPGMKRLGLTKKCFESRELSRRALKSLFDEIIPTPHEKKFIQKAVMELKNERNKV